VSKCPSVEELRRLGLNDEQIKKHLEGWAIANEVRTMPREKDGRPLGIDTREMMARNKVKKRKTPRVPIRRVRIGEHKKDDVSERDLWERSYVWPPVPLHYEELKFRR
jgi:hypothetical protein